MKVGDPPSFPTAIDTCPKCKKKAGWDWQYAKNSDMIGGYGLCLGCGARFG